MAYTPATLSIGTWASPVSIVGTDIIANLDEAVNTIITSDPSSLVNHLNTEMAKVPTYLSAELEKVNTSAISATTALALEAQNSATASATSATASAGSATASATSASASSASATASAGSATASEASKVASETARTGAETAQTASETAQTGSQTAETNASASASSASTSASSSSTSATASAGSATASAGSATSSATSATNAQLRAWEAEAEKMTADSYATEAEDVVVKTYASDGDGTFTATATTEYSALHYNAKASVFDPADYIAKTANSGQEVEIPLHTLTVDTAISFTSIPSGKSAWIIELDANGFTVTWQSAVDWDGDGVEPEWTTGVDLVYFYTTDGGTTIKGMQVRAGA